MIFPKDMNKALKTKLKEDMLIYGNAFFLYNSKKKKYERIEPSEYEKWKKTTVIKKV